MENEKFITTGTHKKTGEPTVKLNEAKTTPKAKKHKTETRKELARQLGTDYAPTMSSAYDKFKTSPLFKDGKLTKEGAEKANTGIGKSTKHAFTEGMTPAGAWEVFETKRNYFYRKQSDGRKEKSKNKIKKYEGYLNVLKENFGIKDEKLPEETGTGEETGTEDEADVEDVNVQVQGLPDEQGQDLLQQARARPATPEGQQIQQDYELPPDQQTTSPPPVDLVNLSRIENLEKILKEQQEKNEEIIKKLSNAVKEEQEIRIKRESELNEERETRKSQENKFNEMITNIKKEAEDELTKRLTKGEQTIRENTEILFNEHVAKREQQLAEKMYLMEQEMAHKEEVLRRQLEDATLVARSIIETKESEIYRLSQDVMNNSFRISSVEQEKFNNENYIKKLLEDKEKITAENKELEQNLRQLADDAETEKRRLRERMEQAINDYNRNKISQEDLKEYQEYIQQKEQEMQEIISRKIAEYKRDHERLEKLNKTLEQQLENAERKEEMLFKEKDVLFAENKRLEEQINKYVELHKTNEQEITLLKNSVSTRDAEKMQLNKKIEEMKKQIDVLGEKHRTSQRAYEEEKKKVRQSINEKLNVESIEKDDDDEIEKIRMENYEKLTQAEKEHVERLKKMEKAKEEEIKAVEAEYKKQLATLNNNYSQAQNENFQLDNELNDYKLRLSRQMEFTTTKKTEIEDLQKHIAEQNDKLQRLQHAYKDFTPRKTKAHKEMADAGISPFKMEFEEDENMQNIKLYVQQLEEMEKQDNSIFGVNPKYAITEKYEIDIRENELKDNAISKQHFRTGKNHKKLPYEYRTINLKQHLRRLYVPSYRAGATMPDTSKPKISMTILKNYLN